MNKDQFQWFINFPVFILFEIIIILIWDYYVPMRMLISLMIYIMYVLVVTANRTNFKDRTPNLKTKPSKKEGSLIAVLRKNGY